MTNNGKPVYNLNELEYVNGNIWSNIFQEDTIVKIDALNGKIVKSLDLKNLRQAEHMYNKANNKRMKNWDYGNNVLNGIAYDPSTAELFVTGKRWSLMFKIKIN